MSDATTTWSTVLLTSRAEVAHRVAALTTDGPTVHARYVGRISETGRPAPESHGWVLACAPRGQHPRGQHVVVKQSSGFAPDRRTATAIMNAAVWLVVTGDRPRNRPLLLILGAAALLAVGAAATALAGAPGPAVPLAGFAAILATLAAAEWRSGHPDPDVLTAAAAALAAATPEEVDIR